jgi:hypothetical protein
MQAPNTADFRGSGTCRQHPLGAGRHIASCLDPLLFLYMERRQMDRKGVLSDSFNLFFCMLNNKWYNFAGI